ncbi:MAG: efflux RND transporter permease subunit [Bacteroidales bacterium]|nr:efflux RND transporter permease subunit [Bacteroidales bacterium]
MKNLITYFIKYPVTGNILIMVIMLVGTLGLLQLNSTLTPQVDPGRIIITAAYPGASPQEIEEGIVLKIEDNLKGITGIDKTSSNSRENMGTVSVHLETNAKADIVLQDVKNAVDGINSFPAGMEPPNVRKIEFITPAIFFSISGDTDLRTLKQKARKIEDDLREIDGISKLELSGFPAEEIEISFREDDLKKYQMTLTEAYTAVKASNIDLTGGLIRGEDEELYVRTMQKKFYADDLKDIVLRTTSNGAIIRLSDVANVVDKWNETPNKTFINGQPAINIRVNHTDREDIIQIASIIKEYILEFNATNDVVKAQVMYDVSKEIDNMQDILLNNGIVGFLLVLLFLSLFLNHRLSFWVAFSLPLSFMGMFILASMYGMTLNKMSLFGMILVIGILVDDGIVIAENIFSHFEKGKKPIKAAIDGTLEVLPAVFSAVLTTIIAFATFFFLDGMFGQFLVEMGFVVIGVLIFSLIEGAFILPAHIAHSKALKRDRKKSKIETATNGWILGLRDNYFAPVLRWSMNNKFLTMAIPTGLLMITAGAYVGIIKTGDSSIQSQDYANISLEMPAGTTEQETLNVLYRIEKAVYDAAEDFDLQRTDGLHVVQNVQLDITASNKGQVTIYLLPGDVRAFHSMEFSNAVREIVGVVPEAQRLNYAQQSHFGKPVNLSLKSYDLEELKAANAELKSELESLAGLKNVVDNNETGMREIKITLKDKAYVLGLDLQTVMNQVRYGFFGLEVQRINRGLDLVKIWVRYEREDRSSIGKLENMRIRTNDGSSYPLTEIANLDYERNLVSINHLNGRREITVEADVMDQTVNLNEIKTEINEKIIPALRAKYEGLTIYQGGHAEEMAKAGKSVMKVVPIVLILLLAVITFTFRSFRQTIMVFILIPFGLIGIGWGHVIHGYSIDLPSYFGIVALMGVMVNDAIVLISRVNQMLKEGKDFITAVYEGTLSRFRAIILTSLTTIAGLFPLILSPDPSAHMVIPMAISVAYGMIVATVITLIFLPVLMIMMNGMKVNINWLWNGTKPQREEVEQAVIEMKAEEEEKLEEVRFN